MVQKALVMLFLFAVTITGSLLFFANLETVSPDRPLPLKEVVEGTDDLAQWKVLWNQPENQINSVGVITNEPDILRVRVNYHYSGKEGDNVFACGAIDERVNHAKWTCKEVAIEPGEGSVELEFQSSEQSESEECSKYIVVNIYRDEGEMPLYNNYYHYKKAWVKGASGMWGRLEQFFHSCQS